MPIAPSTCRTYPTREDALAVLAATDLNGYVLQTNGRFIPLPDAGRFRIYDLVHDQGGRLDASELYRVIQDDDPYGRLFEQTETFETYASVRYAAVALSDVHAAIQRDIETLLYRVASTDPLDQQTALRTLFDAEQFEDDVRLYHLTHPNGPYLTANRDYVLAQPEGTPVRVFRRVRHPERDTVFYRSCTVAKDLFGEPLLHEDPYQN